MLKSILIVEDEPIIADDLSLMLTQEGFHVIDIVDNGTAAIEQIKTSKPDLVLLDIQIKGGLSGIDVARFLVDFNNTAFIFITSYHDSSTLEMIEKVNPNAYIVKPFRKEEVLMNVRLALKKSKEETTADNNSEKIFVRDAGVLKSVNANEILYAKGDDNYTNLVLLEGKEYLISHTLKSIEDKLPANTFCRVHKSYIVNIDKIQMIQGYSLEINQQAIPIGKSYKKGLFEKLQVL